MSDNQLPKTVMSGEVLPPAEPSMSVPALPPDAPLGIPMLGRALYEARAKAFEAYVRYRRTQTDVLRADTERVHAMRGRVEAEEQLATALNRHKNLSLILDADEAKLLSELDDVFEGIKNKAFDKRRTAANLEADALEAEQRLAALKNPPKPPPPEPTEHLSQAQRAARAIKRIKEEFAELRDTLIEAAGGEENLTEEDRSHLDTLELAKENQIRELMESL